MFAEHGHDLILAARRKDRLEALGEELREAHSLEVHVLSADLAVPDGAVRLHSAIAQADLEVGILVNNSGLLAEGNFLDIDLEQHCQILDVNARALMQLTHLFGQDMRRRKRGRILNVCSTSAFQAVPGLASYAATKAFVLSLSEALAMENAAHGITVTALCPGFVQTEMTQKEDGGHMNQPMVPLLTAREVAEQGYRATMKGKTLYINGIGNRLVQTLVKHQPRWVWHSIGKIMEHRKL